MDAQSRIQYILRILLSVIVIPIIATAIFSRFVMSKDVFSNSYSFTVHNLFGEFLKLDCTKDNCDYKDAPADQVQVYRNRPTLITFRASQDNLEPLKSIREQLAQKFNQFVDSASCEKDPSNFISLILIRKIQTQFISDELAKVLYNNLNLIKVIDPKVLKENSKLICLETNSALEGYFMSEVRKAYEHEIKKLKIVVIFYLAVAFIAFLLIYLFPIWKKR